MSIFSNLSGAFFVTLFCTSALATTALTGATAATAIELQAIAPPASATSGPSADGRSKKAISKKKALRKSAKPVFVKGSEETTAERSARLRRECKGGVNAGACAGYTR